MRIKIFSRASLRYLLAIFVCIFASFTFLSSQTSAIKENWNNPVVQKALLSGLRRCYSGGAINNTAGKLSNFKNFNQLIIGGNARDYVALPSGLTNVSDDNNIDCKTLFRGGSWNFDGIFKLAGKSEYNNDIGDINKKVTFLEGMGYTSVDNSANKKCIYYIYGANGISGTRTTEQICFDGSGLSVESTGDTLGPYFHFGNPGDFSKKTGRNLVIEYNNGNNNTIGYVSYADYDGGWDGFVNRLNKQISTNFSVIGEYTLRDNAQNNYGDAEFKMAFSSSGESADKPIRFLSSYQGYDSLSFSDQERISYYVDTIKYWFYAGVETSDYLKCDISDQTMAGTYLMINLNIDSMKKSSTCGIDTRVMRNSQDAYGFTWSRGKPYFDATGSTKLSLEKVVEEINRLTSNMSDTDLPSTTVDTGDTSSAANTCESSGASGSLGWIVCPVLKWMGSAASDLYDGTVKPALEVNASFFTDNTTRDAWGTFRDIANIAFVILVLVVIFSQLTGYGIDNYGIKKILPKLIVAAVLINLSYLICVLCVDLSNILGNGFQGLMDGLAQNVAGGETKSFDDDVSLPLGGLIDTGFVAVGIIGIVYLIYSVVANPAILLTLFISILGVLVSVIFLFVLLAGREALIVLLTVISPIAFVLYMLPNTKKIFDKWLKLWEAMLFLYPICGLLIGGSNFASTLILVTGGGNGGGFGDAVAVFTALVIGIIPIFFIPTLLKGAFAAMGSIGSTISGFGNRLRSGATGRIRNSNAYKEAQKRGQERSQELRTRRRAGIGKDGKPIDVNSKSAFWRLRHGGKRGIARARAQYDKDQRSRMAEGMLLEQDYMTNMTEHREATAKNEREKMYSEVFSRQDKNAVEKELKATLKGKDAEKTSAALSTLLEKGGTEEALDALASLSDTDWNTMRANGIEGRLLQNMGSTKIDAIKTYAIYRQTGGGASFKDWTSGNISAAQQSADARNGVATKYSSYAQHLKMNGGGDALTSYSKDEINFVAKNARSVGGKALGEMLLNTAINSTDTKAKAAAEAAIRAELSSGRMQLRDLGITAEKLSKMRSETALAIEGGAKASGQDIQQALGSQINDLGADEQRRNNTNGTVKKVFGVTPQLNQQALVQQQAMQQQSAAQQQQTQQIIEANRQSFEVNHQLFAEKRGKNLEGEYTPPNNYQLDPKSPANSGIFTDNNGNYYNAKTNSFFRQSSGNNP